MVCLIIDRQIIVFDLKIYKMHINDSKSLLLFFLKVIVNWLLLYVFSVTIFCDRIYFPLAPIFLLMQPFNPCPISLCGCQEDIPIRSNFNIFNNTVVFLFLFFLFCQLLTLIDYLYKRLLRLIWFINRFYAIFSIHLF